MKHARKMVLVDINSTKPNNTTVQNEKKNDEALTKAISSLATSAEFSRAYFGPNSISIANLDNEINQILERKDLEPADKLKLYHQGLKRYLFLQRMSEKSTPTTQIVQGLPTHTANSSQPLVEDSPLVGGISPEGARALSPEPVTPSPLRARGDRIGEFEEVLKTKKSKYRSNLPRTTPKEARLREHNERRKNSRYDEFFTSWSTPKQPKVVRTPKK